jgi:xeroderma pigmentosum group C-complementing protein
MPRSVAPVAKPVSSENNDEGELVNIQGPDSPFGSGSGSSAPGLPLNPRRRLGHPNAAAYLMPEMSTPARVPSKPKQKVIQESPYPVFWVEVFDEAHQKWFPVDPLVTESVAKPRAFEPPSNDRENSMSYVIAFEEEGCARDVTKRYTKAYNAKTRKNRVESTRGGERWWRRTMRAYARGWISDADQIEDTELAAAEAREPMPKNIADFKDHPTYALERHLRRNEVLVRTQAVGRVAAGRDLGIPGGKKMESVYRRRDVKVARSADAWYRLGRDVKMGEQPVKTVAPKARLGDEDFGEEADERAGTNLYTEEQTELYVPPPIVNGRVPKNSYGNLDIFVPSMVPKGGVHLPCKSPDLIV